MNRSLSSKVFLPVLALSLAFCTQNFALAQGDFILDLTEKPNNVSTLDYANSKDSSAFPNKSSFEYTKANYNEETDEIYDENNHKANWWFVIETPNEEDKLIKLRKTEYASNQPTEKDTAIRFDWQENSGYQLAPTEVSPDSEHTFNEIKYEYSSDTTGLRTTKFENSSQTNTDINAQIIGNEDTEGVAVYNESTGSNSAVEMGNVSGVFIKNETEEYGGVIYNHANGENNSAKIGDINADFVQNTSHYGGAVNNTATSYTNGGVSKSEIGNITGSFIGNTAAPRNHYSDGGAIYNYSDASSSSSASAIIGDINADFIGNSATADWSGSGGAIYNYAYEYANSHIGNITGNFIGNSADYGGAIANYGSSAVIESITGDFIGNNASGSGGAIDNGGTIGYIVGDFIANGSSYGTIYNYGRIDSITGDFINNGGGAIYNEGYYEDRGIGQITGNFVQNYGTGIYNEGKIEVIQGDFVQNEYCGIRNEDEIGTIKGNFVENNDGGIYNNRWGTIEEISGNFTQNYGYEYGGAIDNKGRIEDIKGEFVKNSARESGGAIDNTRYIGDITGNFTENYLESYWDARGGAISNYASSYDRGGKSVNLSLYGYAGSPNQSISIIGDINGDFTRNSIEANNNGYGGAISNLVIRSNYAPVTPVNLLLTEEEYYEEEILPLSLSMIGDINGNFIENKINAYKNAYGGAISNKIIHKEEESGPEENNLMPMLALDIDDTDYEEIEIDDVVCIAKIGNIKGGFIKNSATGENAYGGAIYNEGIIGDVDPETGELTGGIINFDFINNYAKSTSPYGEAKGGAIYSSKDIKLIARDGYHSVISGNYTDNNGKIDDNAIYMAADSSSYETEVTEIRGDKFVNEHITSTSTSAPSSVSFEAYTKGVIQIDDKISGDSSSASNVKTTVTTSQDINWDFEYTSWVYDDETGSYYNGYIDTISGDEWRSYYSEGVFKNMDTGKTYAELYDESSDEHYMEDTDTGEIYKMASAEDEYGNWRFVGMKNEPPIITSKIEESGDRINTPYSVKFSGDTTGTVILNNSVENGANVSLDNVNLKLGKRDDVLMGTNMRFNSGAFDMVNNSVGNTNFNVVLFSGNVKTGADVDLKNEVMDRITARHYDVKDNALLDVAYLNLISDTEAQDVDILYADKAFSNKVIYSGSKTVSYTPTHEYEVGYGVNPSDEQGYFSFHKVGFNPSVVNGVIAGTAAQSVITNTFNYAFRHSDAFMNLPSMEKLAFINKNRYALADTGNDWSGGFSPLLTDLHEGGAWLRPYTDFEHISLHHGPNVSSISYGTLVGYDSEIQNLKRGWQRVLTGYIGYNGAIQNYGHGMVDTTLNGGLLGSTITMYKRNFFNATTLSVGADEAFSRTMYGRDNITMLMAGLGNKMGYNFEFKDGRIIFQPNLLLSYTFVNTFDYTNASGVRMDIDPMNGFQIAPGFKFIYNSDEGWQPYLTANMVFNINDKQRTEANGISLPQSRVGHYVQYGAGIQRVFNQDKTAFGQVIVNNGARNGVSLNLGFRFAVGRENGEDNL